MKIPPHAKRVFNGIIFEVYTWQQKGFNGKYETYERIKRVDTVQIIATKSNKILLALQKQPMMPLQYSFLGGRANKNEKPLKAAKRELLEEAGMISKKWELVKVYEPHDKILWNIYLFLAKNCKKVANPKLDPGEKIKMKELTFNQFIKISSSEKFRFANFSNDILRMRLNKSKLNQFKKLLFS